MMVAYPENVLKLLRESEGLDQTDTSRDGEFNELYELIVFRKILDWKGLVGPWDEFILDLIKDVWGVDLITHSFKTEATKITCSDVSMSTDAAISVDGTRVRVGNITTDVVYPQNSIGWLPIPSTTDGSIAFSVGTETSLD